MPVVHRSTLKRARQAEKRRIRNKAVRSYVKGVVKNARTAIQSNDVGASGSLVRDAQVALDKAISKGVIHRNTASRRLSRLARAANALASHRQGAAE